MTVEFPPPDARLAGKVKVIQLSAQRDVLRVACQTAIGRDRASTDADGEISRLAKLGRLEYKRERKTAAKLLKVRARMLDRLVRLNAINPMTAASRVVR